MAKLAKQAASSGITSRVRPVRVCHVCSAHEADDGRIFDRACRELADAGYEVHLIASAQNYQNTNSAGVVVHAAPTFLNRTERLLNRSRIARLAADIDPDIYHVHEPELLGPVVKIANGRPVIWDVHEPYAENISQKHWIPSLVRPVARWMWQRRERALMKRCAAVVVVTDELACSYVGAHNKVCVIRNLPRLGQRELTDHWPRQRSCVYTGTISPNRAIESIVDAITILHQEGLDVGLELSGPFMSADYRNKVLGRIASRGVTHLVRYHGELPRQEALALQVKCSVGLVVETISPGAVVGIPVKMLEYMEAGLPIVYSSLPIVDKLLAGVDCGIAADARKPRDIARAIRTLIEDAVRARRLGLNGARAVREALNWKMESPHLLNLYRSICQ